MPIDDRKQRILTAIVSLYAADAEPVGSQLLSRYFNMAVSSATLRNEMAALTKLGLLEQPHTSAGRVPSAKGYRYYVDNLLGIPAQASPEEKEAIDEIFRSLDYDPEKLAQGAAKAFSDYLHATVITTTPRAEDMRIVHFEVAQVGLYTAAILAVTNAGGVRTRVVKADIELNDAIINRISAVLNRRFCFVAEADISPTMMRQAIDSFGSDSGLFWPFASAALTLMSEVGQPSTYIEGQQYILQWPELQDKLRSIFDLFNNSEMLEEVIAPHGNYTTVRFGEELSPAIPELCLVQRRYLAGGGLSGVIAVVGPARMDFHQMVPRIEYFSNLLGTAMSSSAA